MMIIVDPWNWTALCLVTLTLTEWKSAYLYKISLQSYLEYSIQSQYYVIEYCLMTVYLTISPNQTKLNQQKVQF